MRFFFSSLVNSLYNVNWLKERKDKIGKAFGYFFLLIFLLALIIVLPLSFKFSAKIKEFKGKFNEAVPEFTATMTSSSLLVEGPAQPYIYKTGDEKFVGVLDTVSTSSMDLRDFLTRPDQSGVLITQNKMEFYDGRKKESRISYYKDAVGDVAIKDQDASFTKTQVFDFLNKFTSGNYLTLLVVLATVLVYIGLIVSKLFGVLIISFLVFIVSAIAKKGWKFGQLITVGLYGLTLPSLVVLAVDWYRSFNYLYTLIFLGFMLAVVFTKTETETKPIEPANQNIV